MNRVAVITDIHGNLPALQASLARSTRSASTRSSAAATSSATARTPTRCARLIEEREIPTIYGNYDYAIARDLDDCGCAYVTQHDRELGQQSVAWTLEHTDQASKDFMRELPFDLRFELGRAAGPSGARLAAQGQRVPVRGQARAAVRAARGAPRTATCSCSGTPTSRGSTSTAACCSSTAGRSASPRTATRARRSRSSSSTRHGAVKVSIERVPYDAEAVAREVAAAGLPGEYAEKLVAAA